jgi:hypothetical protein
MTTETIDIQVDDSQLNQLIDALQSLVRGLDKTEKEAKDTASSLDKLDKEARKAGTGANNLSSGLSAAAVAGAAAGGAFIALDLVVKGLEKAFEAATAAFGIWMEETEEGQKLAGQLETAMKQVSIQFGETAVQTEAFRKVMDGLNTLVAIAPGLFKTLGGTIDVLLESLEQTVTLLANLSGIELDLSDNTSALAASIESLVTFLDETNKVLEFVNDKFGPFIRLLADALKTIANMLNPFRGMIGLLERLGRVTVAAGEALGAWEEEPSNGVNRVQEGLQEIEDTVNNIETAGGVDRVFDIQALQQYGQELETVASTYLNMFSPDQVPLSIEFTADPEIPELLRRREIPTLPPRPSIRPTEEENWEFEDWNVTESLRESSEPYRERYELQEQTRSIVADILSDSAATTAEAERQLQIEEDQTEQAERQAQLAAEAAQARITSFQTAGVNAGFDFGQEALRGLLEGSDTLGLDIGQSFSETGFGFLSSQLPALLGATGPIGALIGGGISLIGSLVSGIFERERKRREREARAAAPQNFNTNSNYITTNNVGLVIGDRRAVTQQLSNFNNDTQRRTG